MYTMIPFRPRRALGWPVSNDVVSDRFFRSFFDMTDSFGNAGFRVDIREEDNAYLLDAELPGVKQDQIDLTVDGDALTITAHINSERKDEQPGKYLYSERRSGHFQRSFSLEGIDPERIDARHHDGILSITLPKLSTEAPNTQRKIEIKG